MSVRLATPPKAPKSLPRMPMRKRGALDGSARLPGAPMKLITDPSSPNFIAPPLRDPARPPPGSFLAGLVQRIDRFEGTVPLDDGQKDLVRALVVVRRVGQRRALEIERAAGDG